MPTPDLPQTEAAIIELTNAFRAEQGLAAVAPNVTLRKAAQDFARYLARTDTFSHTADGRQPSDRVKAAGYTYCITSENLASNMDSRGFETRQLARDAVEGWKASPPHRKNLVEPNVTEIGVGIARVAGEHKYLSVQLFGRPASFSYEYRIANRSDQPVAYRAGERALSVEPNVMVTHTDCTPVTLTFESAGRWLFARQTLGTRLEATPGASIVIEPDAAGGGVRVRLEPATLPTGSPAPGNKPRAPRS